MGRTVSSKKSAPKLSRTELLNLYRCHYAGYFISKMGSGGTHPQAPGVKFNKARMDAIRKTQVISPVEIQKLQRQMRSNIRAIANSLDQSLSARHV